MLKRTDLKNVVEEIVKEELDKLINEGRYKSSAQHYKKALSEAPEIGENEIVEFEMGEDMMPGSGGYKKRLRKKNGKLVVIKKRKKKLPLHLRAIKPSQAKRIARKSAIKRKGKQARITRKAMKTTKKGRERGLYKAK